MKSMYDILFRFKTFRARYLHIIAPIGFFGLCMIALLVFLSHLGSKMTEQTSSMIDASMETRVEISLFHLRLEEMMQGVASSSREKTWEHFDNAKWYINAMIKGGQRNDIIYTPLDDPAAAAKVEDVDFHLEEIAKIAMVREQYSSKNPESPATEQEFDLHFGHAIEQSLLLEKILNKIVSRKLAVHKLITFILGGGVLVFACVIAYHFIRNERYHELVEEIIKESEEKFHAIYQSTHVAMVVSTDDKGEIITWNPGAAIAFGYSEDEIINQKLINLIPKRYQEAHAHGFKRAVESGELRLAGRIIELHGLHKDGHEFPIELSLGRWKTRGRTYFSAIINDISERKRIEVEIQKAQKNAEEANKSKSEFLATMSHDLRTPLNAIMGFSELIKDQAFGPIGNPKYNEYAADIHKSGKTLLSLINGILDLSRIEAGKYRLNEKPLNIASLIQEAVNLFRLEADQKKVNIAVMLEPELPKLCADERAINQIINNLISNAVKFTNEGGEIAISANINGSFEVKVTDTGIGMSEQDIAKVLHPFEQADSSQPRKHQGSGLGLYICCNLMRLHGGTLKVDSKEGQGTTVSVRFPLSRLTGQVVA